MEAVKYLLSKRWKQGSESIGLEPIKYRIGTSYSSSTRRVEGCLLVVKLVFLLSDQAENFFFTKLNCRPVHKGSSEDPT